MKEQRKSDRIAAFVNEMSAGAETPLHPCYAGFFTCFNERRYYEAHDVLEHLWLQKQHEDHDYFKGLIQVAGAFVHLQKQYLRPHHPKDGTRLRPAVRLFRLGMNNIEKYRPYHLQLDVENLYQLCSRLAAEIVASDFHVNPWRPDHAPQVFLEQ